MILISFFILFITFSYLYLFIRNIKYINIFFFVSFSIITSFFFLFWQLYQIWFFSFSKDEIILNWSNLDNMIINFSIKENFFNTIIAITMIFGSIIVFSFSFFEMNNDKEGYNFIINLGFFIIFMLILIGSNNIIVFYLGWEGISFTSYILINFWSERIRSIKAVIKVFFISKFGDFFMIAFICFIFKFFGTSDFDTLNVESILLLKQNFYILYDIIHLNEFFGILLVFSCLIKSAQYGAHIWLLEAMEAPLGASALMHSSTLVIAGVIFMFKLSFYIEISTYAQIIMYISGSLSAVMGSFLACFQYELKLILAYSTISNMGYIFMLFSIQAYNEMLLTLVFHAFVKIFMFLIIGSIIYICNGCQDIRWMGGLFIYYPFIFISYIIGSIGLIGLPYFVGYFYKNYLILNLLNNFLYYNGGEFLIYLSYFLTIFYVLRIGFFVFLTTKNGHKNIYKIKKIPEYFYIWIIVLGLLIIFSQNFFINLIYSNINSLNLSIFNTSYLNTIYYIYELNYQSLYLWIISYLFSLFSFFILNLININFKWNFFKNWYIILNFFLSIFFFFFIF